MRPKIVILILVIGVGLVAVVVLLKGVTGGHSGDAGVQTPASETQTHVESPTDATNVQVVQVVQVNSNSSNSAAISEQMRAAMIEKEVDQIRDLQGEADGANNPMIISALLAKLSHPEAEVRRAVLEAVKQMDDTNAVPGLEKVAENIKDPREKVAVMDTIEYLKMPSITDNASPESAIRTNTRSYSATSISTNHLNPNFRPVPKTKGRRLPQNRPQ